ncbi:MAG: single-stranded-DNA-specific exonuclease RecJ [Spirochaetes bacterium]|nr:single-stranded-DNA-specific exonuclease RecJ [Spirochaetota bacterium]
MSIILPESISTAARKLLANRGISSDKDIFDFFNQDICSLSNPFAVKGIATFIERIREAVAHNERILIYGDKDADGITAAATAYSTLKKITKNIDCYIPTHETGYGLSRDVLDGYVAQGVSLIITVDCGISNVDEVALMRERGVDIIVTDHHDVPPVLPAAYAVFNPKIAGSGIPENLSGCGVIFKLLQALVFSYSSYYNNDFIILDASYADDETPAKLRAMRVRNFTAGDVFSAERTAEGRYRSGDAEDEFTVVDVLEELASFMFDSEQTYAVLTGGETKYKKLLAVFHKFGVHPPPVKGVYDLVELGKRYAKADVKKLTTLGAFALACGTNVFTPYEGPHADLLLRKDLFNRLFLMSQSSLMSYLEKHLPVIAVGTVADVVPLLGENRAIVKAGLTGMGQNKHRSIDAILKRSGIDTATVSALNIAWKVAPFINAAGRMGKPSHSFDLLTAEEDEHIERHAGLVDELNIKRKELTERDLGIVKELVAVQADAKNDRVLIVKSDRIEQGLTGLIAGRMVSDYNRPSVVVYENAATGECIGSSRSRNGDNVRMMIESAQDILLKFGGHPNASGFSLKTDNFTAFRELCMKAAETLNFGSGSVLPAYEMTLSFADIDMSLAETVELMAPYGQKNEEPLFATDRVRIDEVTVIGKTEKKHLSLTLTQNDVTHIAMIWRTSEETIDAVKKAETVDIIYTLRVNRYAGSIEPRLHIKEYVLH